MNHDDNRGNTSINRRQLPTRGAYSPSMNYNYNSGGGYGGQQHQGQHGNHNQHGQHGQHPRRRTDRFKRESLNVSERLVKQNDTIIKLLKEIRDRLPPPPEGAVKDATDEAAGYKDDQNMVDETEVPVYQDDSDGESAGEGGQEDESDMQ